MEVGLGGRLDATNAAEPRALGRHRDRARPRQGAGHTLASIAREKAGILRAGRTALHGVEPPAARAALEEEARRLGAELLDADALATWSRKRLGAAGVRRVRLRTPTAEHRLALGMRGAYQARNLRLGVLAAEILRAEQGSRSTRAAIERGARAWRWPGRLRGRGAPGGPPGAARRRAQRGRDREPARRARLPDGRARRTAASRPWRLVFGALDDKPAAAMLRDDRAHGRRAT